MKRFRFPLILLCGGLLTQAGHAAPAPRSGVVDAEALAALDTGLPTASNARIPSAAIRPLGAWQAGRPLLPADAQRLADTLLREGAEPLGVELPAGTTTLVLQLDRARPLRRCQWVNLSTWDGHVALAASAVQLLPESPRWHPAAGGPQSLGDAREEGAAVQEGQLMADARYVRVEITLPQPGRIASLGLFERAAEPMPTAAQPQDEALPASRRLVAAISLAPSPSAAGTRAGRGGGGQVVMVSAGEDPRAAAAMIDGDLATGYTFRESGGRGALAVFDLGRRAAPGRLTVSYRSGVAGQIEAYLLDELPARGEATAVRQALAGRTPDARAPLTAAAANGSPRALQRAGLTLGDRQGRFLALVFVTAKGSETQRSGKDDFKDRVDGKDFGGSRPALTDRGSRPALGDDASTRQTTGGSLQVVEITASGTDRFGPLLTSVRTLTSLPGSPGVPFGSTFTPGSFTSPAGNFTSVSPGVDSAGPLLPVTFAVPQITP